MAEMDLCHNSHPDQKLTNHPTFGPRRCGLLGNTRQTNLDRHLAQKGKQQQKKHSKRINTGPGKSSGGERDVTRKSPIGLTRVAIREVFKGR